MESKLKQPENKKMDKQTWCRVIRINGSNIGCDDEGSILHDNSMLQSGCFPLVGHLPRSR